MKKYAFLFCLLFCFTATKATDYEKQHASFKETLPRDIDAAYKLAVKMTHAAEKENKPEWEAQGLMDEAQALSYMGDFVKAEERLGKALIKARKSGDDRIIYKAWHELGNVYMQVGRNEKALNAYEEALTIAKKRGDKKEQSITLNNMSFVYDAERNFTSAMECLQKAYTLTEEQEMKAELEYSQAHTAALMQQYDKALVWSDKAQAYFTQSNNPERQSALYQLKGNIYLSQKKYEAAGKSVKEALAISEKIADKRSMTQSHMLLAQIALQQKAYARAIAENKSVLVLCKETESGTYMQSAYEQMQVAYTALGKSAEAKNCQQRLLVIGDSLNQLALLEQKAYFEKQLAVKEQEMKLKKEQLEEKKLELQKQEEAKNKRDALPLYLFIGAILLVAAVISIIVMRSRKKKVH